MAELPEVVVPLGQVPYISRISGRQEYLPVAISFVTRHGCDYMLLDLVAALRVRRLANRKLGSLLNVF